MSITTASIQHNYAHRIAADPNTCPVCCGDKSTTDRRFGGKLLHPESTHQPSAVYECLACEVYHAEEVTEGLPERLEADWTSTGPNAWRGIDMRDVSAITSERDNPDVELTMKDGSQLIRTGYPGEGNFDAASRVLHRANLEEA